MTTISLPGQIVRIQRFTLGVPTQFTVVRDGAAVLFLRTWAGDGASCNGTWARPD